MKITKRLWGPYLTAVAIICFQCTVPAQSLYSPSPTEEDEALSNFPCYTGTVYPPPQKIKYSDDFFDLSNVLIKTGNNVAKDSAALDLWLKKIQSAGGKYCFESDAGKPVSLTVNFQIAEKGDATCPDKKEAYVVSILNPGEIRITAHDKTGLTWAFFAMVQLTANKDGKALLRKAEITDWPGLSCKRSTWVNFSFRRAFPSLLMGKLNQVVFYRGPLIMDNPPAELNDYRYFFTRDPHPIWIESVRKTAVLCQDLGIELYIGFLPMHVPGTKPEYKFNAADEEQVGFMLKNWMAVAECGANVYFAYDDYRFPCNPKEKEKFKTAKEADTYVLNYLYSEVKKKYPSFKLIFCPPFYWGPAYDPSPGYGENRDEYLKAIGEKLDKEIDIAWTGKAVWSGKIQKDQVEWITNTIKRKPFHFQNDSSCPHVSAAFYLTDPADVWLWPYDSFYNDITTVMISASFSRIFSALGGACLWNMNSYKPEASVRELVSKFFGEGSWETADEINKALSAVEVYEYKISASSIRDLAKIKEATVRLNKAWDSALKKNASAFKTFSGGIPILIQKQNKFCEELEKARAEGKFSVAGDIESDKINAAKDCSLNKEKDIFLSVFDFSGGDTPRVYVWKQHDKRFGTIIRGKNFANHSLKAGFKTTTPPSKEFYELFISAQGDDSKEQGLSSQCRIAISLNGNVIFSGPAPFVYSEWTARSFKIKGSFLREGENILTIDSLEEKGNAQGPPFFILNYAVVKDVK